MENNIKVKYQRGALTNYLYGYCVLSTFIFILIIFDIITYKTYDDIYKKFSEKDYIDIIQDAEFAITENNFRIVNRINIGEAIQERKGVIFPRNEVILFCNLTTAEEMLKLEPDFISFCPYKITISERLGRSDLEEKIMISTRLLPTDTESTDINNLSVNMNEILRKIVEYAVLEDPFVINLDK
tara:strand:- start:1974 stop:2525 length:552 start_codon:yes stop_codon:yes gene_type:complete